MGMVRSVRSTWRKGSERSEADVLDTLGRVRLLVVDEIGVGYGGDSEQVILFDVIDRRYRDMRPTILISNQDRAGFTQAVGERTFDRLTETARWIAFDWPSYRATARQERA
jgi:DNA replication protein DnaC